MLFACRMKHSPSFHAPLFLLLLTDPQAAEIPSIPLTTCIPRSERMPSRSICSNFAPRLVHIIVHSFPHCFVILFREYHFNNLGFGEEGVAPPQVRKNCINLFCFGKPCICICQEKRQSGLVRVARGVAGPNERAASCPGLPSPASTTCRPEERGLRNRGQEQHCGGGAVGISTHSWRLSPDLGERIRDVAKSGRRAMACLLVWRVCRRGKNGTYSGHSTFRKHW